ncbi:MAG: DUF4011 domain-containing protein [Clostridiales Family XIII bacterium]|jgi:very-short-patch-repair endonuclease|nr:DUF4011 domain-containing protein [Clostridiales Family XIII bacterium]
MIRTLDSAPIPKAAVAPHGGHSNISVLERKLAHWKNQLLDLSKRNRMINYRETKRATLKISEPGFAELFNRLAVSDEELTFQRPIDKDSDLRTFSMLSLLDALSYPISAHVGDMKAEVSLLERKVALHNLRSKSKLAKDEQGTNILYLSFGFIEWRESNAAGAQWLKSPVLMMPVSLKSGSIRTPYTLLRHDDDIEVNPTLDYLFNERYGIDLPAFELDGEESIERYMQTIEEIADQHGWKLLREVSLGLLSFLKISMYHDLNNNYARMLKNRVVRAITGDANAANDMPQELAEFDFDRIAPKDCNQVVNADSSQQEAILLSKAGVSFVMQGPPGTGKSQTITNIIAEALADGKTILFVSEKAAALQVVHRKLTEVGLDDFCLALHSHKANKKEILDNIAANLKLPRESAEYGDMFELTELFQDRQALNQYVAELHEEILPLEKSLYEAFGELSRLQKVPCLPFSIEAPSAVSSTAYNAMLYRVGAYAKALKLLGVKFSENPWNGTTVETVTQRFKEDLAQSADGLPASLLALDRVLSDVVSAFSLNESRTWAGAHRMLSLLDAIENTPPFPRGWAKEEERAALLDKAKGRQREEKAYFETLRDTLAHFDESIFSEDLPAWLEKVRRAMAEPKGLDERIRATASEILANADRFADLAREAIAQLQTILSAYERGGKLLSFSSADALGDVEKLAEILGAILDAPEVKREWFDFTALQRAKQALDDARSHTASLISTRESVLQTWETSVLSINADEMLLRFKTEYASFFKIFKAAYRADTKTIRGASKKAGAKFSDAETIALLRQICEINKESQWLSENERQLTACLGEFYVGETTDWSAIAARISFVEKMRSFFPGGSVPERVIAFLCDKGSHIAVYAEISDVLTALDKEARNSVCAKLSKVFLDCSGKGLKEELIPELSLFLARCDSLIALISKMRIHEIRQMPNDELVDRVKEAERAHETRRELENTCSDYKEFFGARVDGLNTDWDSIISELHSVSALFSIDGASLMTDDFVSAFCDDARYRAKLSAAKADVRRLVAECDGGYAGFKSLFETSADFDNARIDAMADRIVDCLADFTLLDNTIACAETRNSCGELGLADFTEKVERQDNAIEDVVGVFKRGFLRLWIRSAIGAKKTVERFRRHSHDEKIKRFVALDEKRLLIARERIRQTVIKGIPDANRVLPAKDELSVLRREIEKKRRIMPLRKLFKSIPKLLLKLKPCMMMSPLSVAYFLEAESYEFDMVIFDEASQIFPQDAIGSILRGKQAIIAGDGKQLPPTSFFATSTSNDEDDSDEDDEGVGAEIYDSILEETMGVLPNRTLLWHYRSKHESLIAFSNREIYKNELITFPSGANDGADTGVEFVFVENGVYEGKGRNSSEARRCVELVRRHIDRTPDRSLGVVAFSEGQQKTIVLELEKFREQHPEYENFFTEGGEDEFFVKNLENVQGDERDTILFSVGYAKTKEQRDNERSMALRFGPLGRKGGERRLNVAITRAKRNVKLLASILPSDIDVSRTESEGIKMLRQYIAFAMEGSSSLRAGQSETEEDAFLETVAEYLLDRGYKIKKYVGCSKYKIDLAVAHPGDDDCFVAGIECDGPSYASAKSAGDRDHLRKSVLESMGWRMYRVWSPEWTARRDIEGQRLLSFIDAAIEECEKSKKAGPPKQADQTQMASFSETIAGDGRG